MAFVLFRKKFIPIVLVLVGMTVLVSRVGSSPAAAQQGDTIFEVSVAASSDDAEEGLDGRVSMDSAGLDLVLERRNQTVGMRFNGIDIPREAKINSAYVQFHVKDVNSEIASFTIAGVDADNAGTFTTEDGNISSRPRTDASVVWSPMPWLMVGAAGPNQKTTNIASIIQEITLRPGWVSGNSLAILITGSGKRTAESYDGLSDAAPMLHVEYSLGENLNPAVIIRSPARGGATSNEGNTITFTATADDFEEGDVTSSLSWTSDLDGNIGTGESFSIANLSVGVHTITAAATDSNGLTGFDTTKVTVFALSPVLVGAGDIGYDGPRDEETAKLLDNIPGIVFTLGDNTYPKGRDAEFNNFYEPTWGRHKARTFPSVGNHEYETSMASSYFNYFGASAGEAYRGYYSYDLGDWHIVVLNSECIQVGGCGMDSRQGQWLQADLAANPRTCTLAYFHTPLFTSTPLTSLSNVQDFWTLLYNAEADVILNGDAHNYERFAPQNPNGATDAARGIREFIVGTGGRSFVPFTTIAPNSEVRNSNTPGVLKLTLNPTSYNWQFIPIAGGEFTDSGTADCVSSSPPATSTATLTSTPMSTSSPTATNIPTLSAATAAMATPIDEPAISSRLPLPSCVALQLPLLIFLLLVLRRRSIRY